MAVRPVANSSVACWEVINALEECHARGFLWKSVGMCNGAKEKVTACLGAERKKRATANRETARARRDKIKKMEDELGL
jgi:COX assembly protein 2